MTGWSLFMKKNIAWFDKDGNIADYSNLTLSLGVLPLPGNIVVTGSGATDGSLLISWKDNSGVDEARATDRLRVVAVKENKPYVLTGLDAVRSDTRVPVTVPCEAGEKLHLYLYFQDEAQSVASPSIHAEVTIGEGNIELSHENTKPQSTEGTTNVVYNQQYSSGTDVFMDLIAHGSPNPTADGLNIDVQKDRNVYVNGKGATPP
jgi:hypothetical protein